jgi:glycosyltransferase involved in cell wall biosynthesis
MTRELVSHLNKQMQEGVEIITHFDNKELSIGEKRQQMLDKANGLYVVYIDSDDYVPEYYIEEILKAIEKNPDCIGFDISCTGTSGKTASVRNKWKAWTNKKGGYDYVRTPYHKSPIKKEIALKIGFKSLRFGEDADFSLRLKKSKLIKTEVYIPKVMYFYQFKYEDPKTKYGFITDESNNN